MARIDLKITLLGGLLWAGCGGEPQVPEGIECFDDVTVVEEVSELMETVSSAFNGKCVAIKEGEYVIPGLALRAGVHLFSVPGERAVLRGNDDEQRYLVHIGGAKASLTGLMLQGPAKMGVLIETHSARLENTEIREVLDGAVGIRCEEEDCLRAGRILLRNVQLRNSNYGLYAFGAEVRMENCEVSGHQSSGLSGGAGLYILGGSELSLEDSQIVDNQLGAVFDGASTEAELHQVVVSRNSQRGLWAQGLRGTMSRPALRIYGSRSRFEANGIVGIGARDSLGLSLEDLTVSDTVVLPVPTNLAQLSPVGDGIGLFSGSGEAQVSGVTLTNNGRAQAVVDSVGQNVVFDAAVQLSAGPNQHRVVVQNSSAVMVPSVLTSSTSELAISAPQLLLPRP